MDEEDIAGVVPTSSHNHRYADGMAQSGLPGYVGVTGDLSTTPTLVETSHAFNLSSRVG
jgi:hypothetical protein